MELTQEIEEIVLQSNKNAMGLLRNSEFSEALNVLKEVLFIVKRAKDSQEKYKLLGITQNNLGCYYKRAKLPKAALKCLIEACDSEKAGKVDNVNRAGTLLNICAIYSDLGLHKKALKNSKKALELLKTTTKTGNFVSTLVIAFHNTGVEYEFLKQGKESLDYYKCAWDTALKHLGNDHPLTLSTCAAFTEASKSIQEREITELIRYIGKKEEGFKSSPRKWRKTFRAEESLEKGQSGKNKHRQLSPFEKGSHPLMSVQPLKSNVKVRIASVPISPKKKPGCSDTNSEVRRRQISTAPSFPATASRLRQTEAKPSQSPTFLKKKTPANLKSMSPVHNSVQSKNIEKKLKVQIDPLSKTTKHELSPKEKHMLTLGVLEEFEGLKTRARLENLILSKTPVETTSIEKYFPKSQSNYSFPYLIQTQALFKGYSQRQVVMKKHLAAITIQTAVRRYQCKQLFKSIKEAVIFLQSAFRKHLFRKKTSIKSNN